MKRNIHYILGSYLKGHRTALLLRRREVAKVLKCTEQFICNFENGRCSPPGPMLRKLIDIYQLDSNEVLEILIKENTEYWQSMLKIKN